MSNYKNDLGIRTTELGKKSIKLANNLPRNVITNPLISQFIRAATSVGANYCEADESESDRDLIHKLRICQKELKELKHWLQIIVVAVPEAKLEARIFWQEVIELSKIFSTIITKIQKRIK
ncbi:MAG: four helix bundle protein [Patescibacteria group bacterium]